MLFLSMFFIVPNGSYAEDSNTALPENKIEANLSSSPRIIYRVAPVYSREAAKYNLAGNVRIKIKILKDSSIGKISLEGSSGYEILDNAALAAVRQWRFIPARDESGQSIESSILVPISFGASKDPYTIIKSVIDSWNPARLDIYTHPGEYNIDIEQVNEVVKQFDINHFDESLNRLIDAIEAVDVAKKYDGNVYRAVARKMVKKLFPENDLAAQLAKTAWEYRYKSSYKEAISYYDKAIALEPYDAEYYSKRAFAYYLLEDNLNAVSDFTKAIELEPTNYKHYNMRGYNHFILHNYQISEDDYNKAIELDPKVADNYYDRGQLYYQLKEYQKAIDDYNRAIVIESDYYSYYIERGRAYHAMKKYQEAISDYNKAFEMAPNMPVPSLEYCSRGEAYLSLRDYKNAFSDFDKAVKLSPNTADYYNGRGKAFYGLKEYQQAIDDYSMAIAKCPDNPKYKNLKTEYYLNRAAAYKKMGQTKEAADDEQKAYDLDLSQNIKENEQKPTNLTEEK